MANVAEFEEAAIEIHDDGSKELDAGLRPLDHYKQVHRPQPSCANNSDSAINFRYGSLYYRWCDGRLPTLQNYRCGSPLLSMLDICSHNCA